MVLVTGATGLVGSYLVRYLLHSGEEVRALKRPNSNFSLLGDDAKKVNWVSGDILDLASLQEAMEGIDHVYHVAAVVSFLAKEHDRMLKVNKEGTANVVNVALDMHVGKLLYMSGVVTLGKGKENALLDESEENIDADYDTTYGLSKCLGEMEVWRAIMEGLNAVIINPSLVIGAGKWNSYGPGMVGWANRGLPFYAPGSTGFVDVRDVARSAIALMNSNIHNERFIVSAGNFSYREIANMLSLNLGKRERTIAFPQLMMHGLAYIEKYYSMAKHKVPFISPENVHLFYKDYSYSNQKIRERLGFQFTPMEQTLKETCEAFLKSKAEGKSYGVLPL